MNVNAKLPTNFHLGIASDHSCAILIDSTALAPCLPWLDTLDMEDVQSVGRWGESLVFHYLSLTRPECDVKWMNADNESRASYDITLFERSLGGLHGTTFVEVKSTRFADRNVFQLSLWEWEFMITHPRPNYDIYRVYNVGDKNAVKVVVYKNVLRLIQEKKVQLCLAV